MMVKSPTVVVSKKRKRRPNRELLDWLKSGPSPSRFNPYLGLEYYETAMAAEARTPKRPRTRSGKGIRGTARDDNSQYVTRKKVKTRQQRAQKRKSRTGKWDAAYKMMLALPLRSGLSRDEVYAASYTGKASGRRGFDTKQATHRRLMSTFLKSRGWTLRKGGVLTPLTK
jgi:hypothetical protein